MQGLWFPDVNYEPLRCTVLTSCTQGQILWGDTGGNWIHELSFKNLNSASYFTHPSWRQCFFFSISRNLHTHCIQAHILWKTSRIEYSSRKKSTQCWRDLPLRISQIQVQHSNPSSPSTYTFINHTLQETQLETSKQPPQGWARDEAKRKTGDALLKLWDTYSMLFENICRSPSFTEEKKNLLFNAKEF